MAKTLGRCHGTPREFGDAVAALSGCPSAGNGCRCGSVAEMTLVGGAEWGQ
ncbi:hypothetical protein [Mycobacterium haemophilum]|uniref:hypothetical protein n=1 Tax=Mycobacterium haemophilum TaxID=29311 RepID=UPI000AC0D9A0|nr:hypothetical protein [Mycobacterium haemophilum]MCV7341084.1 hypothetical protein [Mycobacterium haemophilum DSM 44634]